MTDQTNGWAFGHARLAEFELAPDRVHLNHGSFGAVPHALAQEQVRWRAEIEQNPSDFFRSRLKPLLRDGADRIACAFGGTGADWVHVENATQGANAVIGALELAPGDHVIATSEIYNAVRQALAHHSGRHGVEIEEIPLIPPVNSPDQVLTAIEDTIRPRTRAIFADHITSNAALLLPAAAIAALARARGIACFIDGAHVPGQLDLDVSAIDADWYVGNAHKWLYAPRGAAMLWTRPDWQERTHPVVISHGYGSGYTEEFDWVGTRDPTAWLSIPAALGWHEAQGGAHLRRRGHEVALAMGRRLAEAFGTEMSGPPEMTAAMATVRLPGPPEPEHGRHGIIMDRDHRVVVSINQIGSADWLRVSAAIYTEVSDMERVIDAVRVG